MFVARTSAPPWRAEHVDDATGLVERLAVLLLRLGVGHDAAARAEIQTSTPRDGCPDGDARVELARETPVADRAAVHTARRRLKLRDDLHRAQLGSAGDRPARKRGAQQVERIRLR